MNRRLAQMLKAKKLLLQHITRVCRFILENFPSPKKHRKPLTLVEWHLRKKPDQEISFSVVTAVYNTEKYLDDYFKSLTRQTLDFRKHIRLILVDDGSTDSSAAIIKKWQKKYPDNIVYISQKNQGVAVARNTGFALAEDLWVTFIDSDDFVHPNYFYHVATAIFEHQENDLKMLACRIISYHEKRIIAFKDDRPFRVFFTEPYTIYPASDLKEAMHMTLSTAFFNVKEIRSQGLSFKTQSNWPAFKDAYVVLQYLSGCKGGTCLFARHPRYYYRKRAAKTSIIDVSTRNPQYFLNQLEEGYLSILQHYNNKFGEIPLFVQRTILYDMSFRIKMVLAKPEAILIISPDEQQKFLQLCDKIFAYIDEKTIINFSHIFSGFNIHHKLGTLNCFKKINCISKYILINEYAHKAKLIKFTYHSSNGNDIEYLFYNAEQNIHPVSSKITPLNFLNRVFIYEKNICLPMGAEDKLSCKDAYGNHIQFQLKNAPPRYTIDYATALDAFS